MKISLTKLITYLFEFQLWILFVLNFSFSLLKRIPQIGHESVIRKLVSFLIDHDICDFFSWNSWNSTLNAMYLLFCFVLIWTLPHSDNFSLFVSINFRMEKIRIFPKDVSVTYKSLTSQKFNFFSFFFYVHSNETVYKRKFSISQGYPFM